jgi:hypothetical protein
MDKKEKEALLAKVRGKLKEGKGSRRDPNMFRVVNVKPDETKKYRFVVLPGLKKGDPCDGGTVGKGMDDMFCISGGQHWINGRPYECPRLFDGADCPWCNFGFNLLNECDIEEERRKISRNYLPRSIFVVNIYFPPYAVNPPELHNKVLFYIMPKTVYDKMEDCLMREDAGDDPEHDPKPFGMFYDPEDCLTFQLEVTHKGGFNNYENSKFLLKRSSLAETDKDINSILAQRHDLWSKFNERNAEELEKLLEKLYSGGGAPREEKKAEEKPPAPQKAADPDDDVMPSSRKSAPAPAAESKTKEEPLPTSRKEEPDISDDVDDDELKALLDEVDDQEE